MKTIKEKQNPLGYEPIGKLMLKFGLPSIVTMLVNSLYNIVDQVFIGQGVGYLGNAATNIIFPLTVMSIALGIMFGDGGSAFISLNLGCGNRKEASKGPGNVIILVLSLGIILCTAFLLFTEPLCRLFGATTPVMPYAKEYGRIIALGLPLMMFSGSVSALIRADGSPRYSMINMLVGCIVNVILDPIFIFVFHWGVAGAAWATVIGQLMSAIMAFCYLSKFKTIDFNKSCLKLQRDIVKKIASLGVSSFITHAAIVIVIVMFNKVLTKYGALSIYGAEIPLAAHGITMKVNQIVTGICTGLTSGCQPIMGFNYGARQYARVRKTILRCIAFAITVMAVATFVYQVFPQYIVKIFGSESDLYNQFAVMSFRIFLLTAVLNGFSNCSGAFFQAIGKPIHAAVISFLRLIVLLVPSVIITSAIMGLDGVLWGAPIADAMSFLVAFVFISKELRLLKTAQKAAEKTELTYE